MTIRIGVNGLGRIGRCVLRALVEHDYQDIELVAANGPADIDSHIHFLSYDSVHGRFPGIQKVADDQIDMGKGPITISNHREPENIPWGELGVDIVLECTGIFKSKEDASRHLTAGAKKVIISAPSPDPDAMIVYGVNNDVLDPSDQVISVGSCTTNCLAPVVKVLHDAIGIERGFVTTIHAYTNDQNLMDNKHKDLCRARGAALSMIPTSTGAAKAIGVVLPELSGKLDGTAVRVPTPNVSLVDLTFTASRSTGDKEINNAISKHADSGTYTNVLAYNDTPLVSIDFNHTAYSSVFDASGTKVIDKNFCRVVAWYDNEWGFANRMLDVTKLAGSL